VAASDGCARQRNEEKRRIEVIIVQGIIQSLWWNTQHFNLLSYVLGFMLGLSTTLIGAHKKSKRPLTSQELLDQEIAALRSENIDMNKEIEELLDRISKMQTDWRF